MHTKTCEVCKHKFQTKRSDKKTCSTGCRTAKWAINAAKKRKSLTRSKQQR